MALVPWLTLLCWSGITSRRVRARPRGQGPGRTLGGQPGRSTRDLQKIVSKDPAIVDPRSGTRNEFLRNLGRKLNLTVTGFNTFRSDPQLKQISAEPGERAERTTFSDAQGQSGA